MKRLLFVIPLALGLTATLTASADAPVEHANVPPELRVPDGHHRVLTSVGHGIQIYDCADSAWKLREPVATLDRHNERPIALHYLGPTWQSIHDGSKVVGAVKARRDAPRPERDIPWLLLQGTSTTGPGVFGAVAYIQRLETAGGVAPAGACTSGQTTTVPYRAAYVFWAPAR